MTDHAKRRQERLDRLAELSKLLQDSPASPVPVVTQETPKLPRKPPVIPPVMVLERISVERELKAKIEPVLAHELQKIVDIGALSPSEARQFSEQTGGKDAAQVIAQAQAALSQLQGGKKPAIDPEAGRNASGFSVYNLAKLEPALARHWLAFDCWEQEEALLLLLGLEPRLYRLGGFHEREPNAEGMPERLTEVANHLERARKAQTLMFPERPLVVIEWAMSKGFRLPDLLIPDGAFVADGRWHQEGPRARAHFVEPQVATQPRYIAGRRLWELPEAIEHIAAMPAFGVSTLALTEAVKGDAEKGMITLRDLTNGKAIKSDGMALFLRMSLYAEDFNAWLGAAGYPEPYRLPTADAVTLLAMSGAPGQSLGGEAATLPGWQLNKPAEVTPAAPAKGGKGQGKVWTDERKAEARAYRKVHGLKLTAKFYGVSEATISKHVPAEKEAKPQGFSAFTHLIK